MGVEGETSNGGKQESLSIDEKEEGFIDTNDLLIRRMKNRERQRRYRARKRQREEEADETHCNGAAATTQSYEVAIRLEEPEIYTSVENFARRVYCSRDWKQDARKAHLNNTNNDGLADSSSLLRRRIWPCRRDWKAEARKMKN